MLLARVNWSRLIVWYIQPNSKKVVFWIFALWVCNHAQCTMQQFRRQPFFELGVYRVDFGNFKFLRFFHLMLMHLVSRTIGLWSNVLMLSADKLNKNSSHVTCLLGAFVFLFLLYNLRQAWRRRFLWVICLRYSEKWYLLNSFKNVHWWYFFAAISTFFTYGEQLILIFNRFIVLVDVICGLLKF